jgi:hypothetical protein
LLPIGRGRSASAAATPVTGDAVVMADFLNAALVLAVVVADTAAAVE